MVITCAMALIMLVGIHIAELPNLFFIPRLAAASPVSFTSKYLTCQVVLSIFISLISPIICACEVTTCNLLISLKLITRKCLWHTLFTLNISFVLSFAASIVQYIGLFLEKKFGKRKLPSITGYSCFCWIYLSAGVFAVTWIRAK